MNLDDYRGRLLARAFHDELEKLAAFVGQVGSLRSRPPKAPPVKVGPPGATLVGSAARKGSMVNVRDLPTDKGKASI